MRFLLASALLLGIGCVATSAPPDPDAARIRELDERVARLVGVARTATLVEDEILALEVERAALRVTYADEHPSLLKVDRKIEALESAEEARARREKMARQLEAQRAELLVTYSADHDIVRRLDAQIAFLRSDQG
ncbi:MAG: hypothetical protein ACHQ1G_01960 [Planctomycetota bacterium]